MAGKTTRWFHASIGIMLAVVFLWLSLRKVDGDELLECVRSAEWIYLVPILVTIILFFWLKAIRWKLLLAPLRPQSPLKVSDVVPAMMIGFMGNNVLPAHLGEFVRMFVLGKQHGLNKTSVLSTIVLERVLDFLAIIAILAVTLQFVPLTEDLEIIRSAGYLVGAACLGAFLLFLGFVWQTERTLRIAEKALRLLPQALRRRLLDLLQTSIEGLSSVRSLRVILVLSLLTLVHWGMNGLGIYLSVISFTQGNPPPAIAALFLLGVAALGVTIPSAPGYVGTIQYCFVLALGVFHVAEEPALAASFYYLALYYFPVTLVGLFFVTRLGLRLGSLSREAEEVKDGVQGNLERVAQKGAPEREPALTPPSSGRGGAGAP